MKVNNPMRVLLQLPSPSLLGWAKLTVPRAEGHLKSESWCVGFLLDRVQETDPRAIFGSFEEGFESGTPQSPESGAG
jgi:hypothetical protein